MSRKCPECQEGGGRPHLASCPYAPDGPEREAFIRQHAVGIVRDLEEKVRRQALELAKLNHRIKELRREMGRKKGRESPPGRREG